MKSIYTLVGGLFFAILSSAPALADSFSFTLDIYCQQNTTANCHQLGSNQFDATNLTLIGTSMGNGKYTITSMSGTINEGSGGSASANSPQTIVSVIAANGFGGNDNILTYPGTSSSYFDSNGLSFLLSDGAKIRIYASGSSTQSFQEGPAYGGENSQQSGLLVLSGPTAIVPGTPAAVTPEPSSVLLLGTGVLSLAGAIRRRFSL